MIDREIKTTLNTILPLISGAEDYGYIHDELYEAVSNIIGKKLSDKEIESYAQSVLETDGYDKGDYRDVKNRLFWFREKFIEV